MNPELDRFKRRLIRTVARLVLQEKKPPAEVWETMRKNTKLDCEALWVRMRALTIKKLMRLFSVNDYSLKLGHVARMSLTDWLMFDLILVHEPVSVITGEEGSPHELSQSLALRELFTLVQQLDVQNLTDPGELVHAWAEITVRYNRDGRECSPMLLQKRWHQMQALVRQRFYDFWRIYRGNVKLIDRAMAQAPNQLEQDIAKKYPMLIASEFLTWEECLSKGLVILPEVLQANMQKKFAEKPADVVPDDNIIDDESDIVLLEPNIETIDIGEDSDADESPTVKDTSSTNDTPIVNIEVTSNKTDFENEEADAPEQSVDATTTDEDLTLVNSIIDTDAANKDNFELETVKIGSCEPCSDSGENVTEVSQNDENNFVTVKQEVFEPALSNEAEADGLCNVKILDAAHVPTEVIDPPKSNETTTVEENFTYNDNPCFYEDDCIIIKKENIILPVTDCHKNIDHQAVVGIERKENCNETMSTDKKFKAKVLDEKNKQIIDKSEIQDVIGHLAEIIKSDLNCKSSLKINETSSSFDDNSDILFEEDNYINMDTENAAETFTEENHEENECYTKEEVYNKTIPMETDSADPKIDDVGIEFVDDGIEFVDDGIEFDEDENMPIDSNDSKGKTGEVTTENSEIQEEGESQVEGNVPKFDLKLLMEPVVYTTKLDSMVVLKNKVFDCVKNQLIINNILLESKPFSSKSENLKPVHQLESISTLAFVNSEKNKSDDLIQLTTSDEKVIDDNELSNDSGDEINDDKKVKVTHYSLQKPRVLNYTPLQICKNPDFNTRLKRLSAGFLMIERNRHFLKACKPMTVDLSKTFESKLIGNTMYLKPADFEVISESIVDVDNHSTSITPSAMPAHCLFANSKVNIKKLLSQHEIVNIPDDILAERKNKVINLPDITKVRRINQHLLTAEVLPIQGHSNQTQSISTEAVVQPSISKENVSIETAKPQKHLSCDEKIKDLNRNISQLANEIEPDELNLILNSVETPQIFTPTDSSNLKTNTQDEKNVPVTETKVLSESKACLDHKDTIDKPQLLNANNGSLGSYKPRVKTMVTTSNTKEALKPWYMGIRRQKPCNTGDFLLALDTVYKLFNILNKDTGKPEVAVKKPKAPPVAKPKAPPVAKVKKPRIKKKLDTTSADFLIAKQKYVTMITTLNSKSDLATNQNWFCCWVSAKSELLKKSSDSTFVLPPHGCLNSESGFCKCCCGNSVGFVDPLNPEKNTVNQNMIPETCNTADLQNAVIQDNSTVDNVETEVESALTNLNEARYLNSLSPKDKRPTVTVVNQPPLRVYSIRKNKHGADMPRNKNYPMAHIVIDGTKIVTAGTQTLTDCISTEIPTSQNFDSHIDTLETLNVLNQNSNTHVTASPNLNCSRESDDFIILSDDDDNNESITKSTPVSSHISDKHQEQQIIDSFNIDPVAPKIQSPQFSPIKDSSTGEIKTPLNLGRNKILLTTVKIPREILDKDHKNMPIVNSSINVNSICPQIISSQSPDIEGVNFMLTSLGEVMCVIDPNAPLNQTKMDKLEQIMSLVQEQIYEKGKSGIETTATNINNIDLNLLSRTESQPLDAAPTTNLSLNLMSSKVTQPLDAAPTTNLNQNLLSSKETQPLDVTSTTNLNQACIIDVAKDLTETKLNEVSDYTVTDQSVDVESSTCESTLMEEIVQTSRKQSNENFERIVSKETIENNVDINNDVDIDSISNNSKLIEEKLCEVQAAQHIKQLNSAMINECDVNQKKMQQCGTEHEPRNSVCINSEVMENEEGKIKENTTDSTGGKTAVYQSTVQQIKVKDFAIMTCEKAQDEEEKKKSILSDLMEMSGISATDTLSQDHESQVVNLPHSITSSDFLNSPVADSARELTPVTSIHALKYAHQNNGVFFKLDLETGVMLPIRIGIQKDKKKRRLQNARKIAPHSFIDLTESSVDCQASSLLRIAPKKANKQYKENKVKIVIQKQNVKPISIQNKNLDSSQPKRKRGRPPKILIPHKTEHPVQISTKKRNDNVVGSGNDFTCNKTLILNKKPRLPRKAKLEAKIDLVDSDAPMEEEYLVESSESDCEDLSKKDSDYVPKYLPKSHDQKTLIEVSQKVLFTLKDNLGSQYNNKRKLESDLEHIQESDESDDEPLAFKAKRRITVDEPNNTESPNTDEIEINSGVSDTALNHNSITEASKSDNAQTPQNRNSTVVSVRTAGEQEQILDGLYCASDEDFATHGTPDDPGSPDLFSDEGENDDDSDGETVLGF